MSYRNQYSGSPWQQGGIPFGMGSYGGNYDQYQRMDTGYSRGYGGMYGGGGGFREMRNMGVFPSPSRHYMNDRMGGGGRQMMARGNQMQRKRLPQSSPSGEPRSKRPNYGGGDSRRRSKPSQQPRRRQESKRGSRHGRKPGKKGDDEKKTPNLTKSTNDISDTECFDGFEILKASDDEAIEDAVVPKTESSVEENGEQQNTEEAEKNEEEQTKPATPKEMACYVCKVLSFSVDKYNKHVESKEHIAKIEELLSIRREKAASGEDDKDSAKKIPGQPWCAVCKSTFDGVFIKHRKTKAHCKKRDEKYPKCRPCRLEFKNIEECKEHCKSEDHKQSSAEFYYLNGLLSGSDEDEDALGPIEVEPEEQQPEEEDSKIEIKMEVDAVVEVKKTEREPAAEDATNSQEAETEGKPADVEEKDSPKKEDSEKEKEKKKPKKPTEHGQSFVVSVKGYFCKLCRKFFKDVTAAKSKHIRSAMHIGAYKKAMVEAFKQEGERQKLEDEQEKIDKEAAEAAELAAEIAAIQRSAKEAIKKAAAKKKEKETKGESDFEMKEVDSIKGEANEEETSDNIDDSTPGKLANGDGASSEEQPSAPKEEEEKEDDVGEEPKETREEVASPAI